jgi:hypothetical protein
MKSAVVLFCLAGAASAGTIRGAPAAPAAAAVPVVPAAGTPEAIEHAVKEAATSKSASMVPMGFANGAKPGYVPTWTNGAMNANVKAIQDSWANQEGKLGYYNGHFGYGPNVHPDLASQVNPFVAPSAYAGTPAGTDASKLVPVTLPNGMKMNVPSAYTGATTSSISSTPVIDANKLLGAPVTLPGTPEHYKDVTQRIMAEQQTVGAQLQQVAQVETQHAQRAAYLGAMMHQLQTQYLQAQHLDHLQKQYMEKMARRNAALGIDRHRVQDEYALGALLQQYNGVKAYETHVRSVVSQIDIVKNNLMKEIMSYRQNIRKDTNAIKELLDGRIPGASGASGASGPSGDEAKLEEKEAEALKLSQSAADKQKSADAASVKANEDFIQHVESNLNKGPDSSSSGPAAEEKPATEERASA